MREKQIILANPRGFCAGVDRAIDIVEQALKRFAQPIYVRHEVVHNRYVVESLCAKGVKFVESLDDIPDGATVIFSAHGVPKAVVEEAERRSFRVFDATCPLVTKVHLEVERFARAGLDVILIGHAGHPEVEGTLGQFDTSLGRTISLIETVDDVITLEVKDPDHLAYVTQTTLSFDDTSDIVSALGQRFPLIVGPKKNDICYATQNRQDEVKALSDSCDTVLVVGSPNSSNSRRLREVAEKRGCPAFLIDTAEEIDKAWLDGKDIIGVTAGASAPEILVEQVVEELTQYGYRLNTANAKINENVVFPLPRELR